MLDLWIKAVGNCPQGCEALQYVFCCICVIMVITLIFRFIINLLKIFFGKE